MATARALKVRHSRYKSDLLVVDVSRGFQGVAFAIYPLSREYLQELVPDIRMLPRVCLDRGRPSDFEQIDLPLQEQVIQLLTGMSLGRLRELGLRVEFTDVHSEKVLATLYPAATPASSASIGSSSP